MPKRNPPITPREDQKQAPEKQPIVIIPSDPFGLWKIAPTITIDTPAIESTRKSIVI
jgi:hypothetical protein